MKVKKRGDEGMAIELERFLLLTCRTFPSCENRGKGEEALFLPIQDGLGRPLLLPLTPAEFLGRRALKFHIRGLLN